MLGVDAMMSPRAVEAEVEALVGVKVCAQTCIHLQQGADGAARRLVEYLGCFGDLEVTHS